MREICSAWEILSQQTIGVLVAAALPRAAWIAEINLHVGGNRWQRSRGQAPAFFGQTSEV
jgi:hypothetical protein